MVRDSAGVGSLFNIQNSKFALSRGDIWLVSIPLYGHLGPLLLQGAELARRGWRVSVATTEEARPAVERHPELRFLSLGRMEMDPAAAVAMVARVTAEPDFLKGMMVILSGLDQAWTVVYDGLVAALEKERPRLMVVDLATTAGLDAAEAAGVPLVVNNADLLPVLPAGLFPPAPGVPSLFSGRSIHHPSKLPRWLHPARRVVEMKAASLTVGRLQNRLRRSRGLPPVDFHERLRGRLVLVNSAFGLEYPRPLPPQVHMVGPMLPPLEPLPPELARWLEEGPPVALVSLGTVSAPSAELLGRMAQGLRSDDFRALWALRSDLHPLLPHPLPGNVRVEAWLPQLAAVLHHPRVRAFVSHCGTNSVQESLLQGTPVVGIPLFGPQRDMAIRLEDSGVGVHLSKHRFTPDELREAVGRVIREERFRRNIPAIQASLLEAGGVGRAAELIEAAAGG
jgi:UDP:flavonoid glycosyltransferase YjiC (YdhE family)